MSAALDLKAVFGGAQASDERLSSSSDLLGRSLWLWWIDQHTPAG